MRSRRRRGCWLPSRYTVLIAEKPRAAEKIAAALGRYYKCTYAGIPYWIVYADGESLVVAPSAGHLYGPYTNTRGYPVFTYEWRPLWMIDQKERHLKKFHDLLAYILSKAKLYVNACDYDVEGSVIGYMIILNLGDPRRAYRMKFSSLAPAEIRQAYRKLQPLDWDMIEAGLARHELDWLWGINSSRALMRALQRISGKRFILSAGRVQSPTLVEAVRRWRIRNLHVPIPTYRLQITLDYNGVVFNAHPRGWSPSSREELIGIINELRREGSLLSKGFSRGTRSIKPPPAFNLGDLQAEAARLYGFSPMKTQEIAENLYLEALISYPRTNSQRLPPTIDYVGIIESLRGIPEYSSLASRLLRETGGILKPVQGRKYDPAHPAIHPTGEKPKRRLSPDEAKIYDLIVRRFLAAFASEALVSTIRLELRDSRGRPYGAEGVIIEKEGWMHYYIYLKPRQRLVPPIPKGREVKIVKVSYETKWTRPSIDLTKTSLLKWMESVNIGTEGTRARIIEQLFRRRYLESKGRNVIVTDLGFTVASIIEELFPEMAKPDLTRLFEEMLEDIRRGKRTRSEVLSEAKATIADLIKEFESKSREVGLKLATSIGLIEPKRRCLLCKRESVTGEPAPLCQLHWEALRELRNKLMEVSTRLSTSPREALEAIARRRTETGAWILDVARLALKDHRLLNYLLPS